MVAAGGFASRLGPEPASESLGQDDMEFHEHVTLLQRDNAIDVPEAAAIGQPAFAGAVSGPSVLKDATVGAAQATPRC
jgi:hypothetical protein